MFICRNKQTFVSIQLYLNLCLLYNIFIFLNWNLFSSALHNNNTTSSTVDRNSLDNLRLEIGCELSVFSKHLSLTEPLYLKTRSYSIIAIDFCGYLTTTLDKLLFYSFLNSVLLHKTSDRDIYIRGTTRNA